MSLTDAEKEAVFLALSDSYDDLLTTVEEIAIDRVAAVVDRLADPLCAAICDLLGEPRILVPGEVSALLQRSLNARPQTAADMSGDTRGVGG